MTVSRIRIGNQTAFSASSLTGPFEYAVAHGFDAFEWFPDKKESGAGWKVDEIPEELRAAIRNTASQHDIALAVHASVGPLPETNDALTKEITFAREVGASLINVHYDGSNGIESFADSLISLMKLLSGSGLKLSVENTVVSGPEEFNRLFGLLSGLSGVGMCLDLGHANLCSATRNDFLKFIDLLDAKVPIIHLHLHENYGESDSHLPLFTGPAASDPSGIEGLVKRLRKRNFAGCIILEQWPQPPVLLDRARDRLLDLIGRTSDTQTSYPDQFVKRIADAEQRHGSWRNRLGWIHDLLIDESSDLGIDELVYLAVYLRFIGTGEVPCREDGGHYRPSYHAKMSRRIFKRLVRITTPENALIVRKIHPWLPSFDEPFERAEPLTRIRDIAHRNDIPRELKQEIKTTLQNKLHRSAGPEDLVTSAAILRKITAPGAGYSPSFVEEFIRFHKELEEFFNAGSLKDRLLSSTASAELDASLVEAFIRQTEEKGLTPEVSSMETVIALREKIAALLDGQIGPQAQRLLVADIGLEDYSFSLLSRLNNIFDAARGLPGWPALLTCLHMSVKNLRLSGLRPSECSAVESEITAWSEDFNSGSRLHLLRLYATLDRCRRIASSYCEMVLGLFPVKAERLGHALGVPDHAIRVYAESDIRAHPVFQVSRLVDTLSRQIRGLSGLSPWDIIVSGRAIGQLVVSSRMDNAAIDRDEPFVLLTDKLTGDEDIPPGLNGIITLQETPHLSHLAVRARQKNVVFVVCEEDGLCAPVRNLVGKTVSLDASGDRVFCEVYHGPQHKVEATVPSVMPPEMTAPSENKGIPLEGATLENSGPKGYSLRRLSELSHAEDAGFRVPIAFVAPFGCMEGAIKLSPRRSEYDDLVRRLDHTPADGVEELLRQICRIISGLELPKEMIPSSAVFHTGARLMVRSSASSEDRGDYAEAGLYRSIPNVTHAGLADAMRIVWSSLWSRMAVLSRSAAGLPHASARMAVLIQQMVVPDYAFILHSVNPLTGDRDEVYAELAVGLGETLASGKIPGTPYRLACKPAVGTVEVSAFASFSDCLRPDKTKGLTKTTIDYATVEFSRNSEALQKKGLVLGKIGKYVERALGGPQDIEGMIAGDAIWLVQSRPQTGL